MNDGYSASTKKSEHWDFITKGSALDVIVQFAKSMQWRPIDDAPKDGAPVYVLETDGTQGIARWKGEWLSTGCIDDYLTYDPTHFAPLLPAPKGDV